MNDDRRDAIVRLLDVRYEGLPEPRRRVEHTAGFVNNATARVTCEDCLANDKPRFGCETCGGRGYVEVKRERDPYASGAPVAAFGLDGARHQAARDRDREISMLERQTRPAADVNEAEDAKRNPYGWERARARLYTIYHLAELDRALERLHLSHPGWSPYSDRGLGYLSGRLPDPLRAPGPEPEKRVRGPVRPEAGPATLATRDAEMRAAAAEGASVKQLCARFGVSKSTVYAVVNQEAA